MSNHLLSQEEIDALLKKDPAPRDVTSGAAKLTPEEIDALGKSATYPWELPQQHYHKSLAIGLELLLPQFPSLIKRHFPEIIQYHT